MSFQSVQPKVSFLQAILEAAYQERPSLRLVTGVIRRAILDIDLQYIATLRPRQRQT